MGTRSLFKPFFSRPLPFTSSSTSRHFPREFLLLLSQIPSDPKSLTALDSLLSRSHHLLDPTTSVLVLRGLSLTLKLTRAKSVLSNICRRNNVPRPFLYSVALQCLLPNAPISDVETLWRDIASSDDVIDVSDFVIYLCRHGERVSVLEQIYARISSHGPKLTRQAYAALIGAACRNENLNPAFARMVLNDIVENGYEPDAISYFIAFRCFCCVGSIPEADSLLRDWSKRCDLELDVSIYGYYLYGLCKSGRFREARKLFDKMSRRSCGRRIGLDSNPLPKPGRRAIFQLAIAGSISETVAFEAYLRALCSARKLDEAEGLMKLVRKKSTVPEVCVYGSFIRALCRAGRTEDAVKFFEAEKRRGHISSTDIVVPLVLGLCEVGRARQGYELLGDMASEGLVPTVRVYNRILECYWKNGDADQAANLFDEIKSGCCGGCATRPDAETYGVMIRRFLEKGELDAGIGLLKEMVKEKLEPGIHLYSTVVHSLHAQGRVEESNEYLNRMIENRILVSYADWESLYDSMTASRSGEDIAQLWKRIELNVKKIESCGKRK